MTEFFMGGIANIMVLFLVVAGIWKVFQMATDLREMKGILNDMKRNTQSYAPPAPAPAASNELTPEELVRRVHAQTFDDDTPALDPTVMPPQV